MDEVLGACDQCENEVEISYRNAVFQHFTAEEWFDYIELVCPVCSFTHRLFVSGQPGYNELVRELPVWEQEEAEDEIAEGYADIFGYYAPRARDVGPAVGRHLILLKRLAERFYCPN